MDVESKLSSSRESQPIGGREYPERLEVPEESASLDGLSSSLGARYREALRPDRHFDFGGGDGFVMDGLHTVADIARKHTRIMSMGVDPWTGVMVPLNTRGQLLEREAFEEYVAAGRAFYANADKARLTACNVILGAEEMYFDLCNHPSPGAVAEPVYVLRSQCNLHKIGRSRDVGVRLRSLAGANPRPLTLLYVLPVRNSPMAETYLHRRYEEFRVHHEWFDLPPWALAELERLRDDLCERSPEGCESPGRPLRERA